MQPQLWAIWNISANFTYIHLSTLNLQLDWSIYWLAVFVRKKLSYNFWRRLWTKPWISMECLLSTRKNLKKNNNLPTNKNSPSLLNSSNYLYSSSIRSSDNLYWQKLQDCICFGWTTKDMIIKDWNTWYNFLGILMNCVFNLKYKTIKFSQEKGLVDKYPVKVIFIHTNRPLKARPIMKCSTWSKKE